MKIQTGLGVLGFCCALAACASAGPVEGSLEVSADGQEVTDLAKGRVWRRCAEGMSWTGRVCEGLASGFNYSSAAQQAVLEARSSGKAWRVPTVQELSHIADKDFPGATINPKFFPATPAMQFWSSTEVNAAQYNPDGMYGASYAWVVNFANARSGGTLMTEPGALRLVRSLK